MATVCLGLTVLAQNGNGNGNNSFPTNGNVGIGTAAPSEKLRVAGDMRVDSSMVVTKDATFESSARVEEDLKVNGQLYVPNMTESSQLDDSKLTFIDPTGAIVRGNESSTRVFLANALYNDTRGCSADYLALPLWKSGQNKIYSPCPEVNVGINTSDPQYRLHVVGQTYLTNQVGVGTDPTTATMLSIKSGTVPSIGINVDYMYTGNYGYAIRTNVSNPTTKAIGVYNTQTGADAFVVYADGRVQVSSGGQKIWQLENSGLMRGRRIKLDTDTWADYVFESDYSLRSLSDLEQFIKVEKHLPNVPSQKEVLEDGIDLGQMNIVLLEKVEELTLYLIDQNKQLEEQKAKVNELEKKVSALESNH